MEKRTWVKRKYGFRFKIFFDGDKTTTAVLIDPAKVGVYEFTKRFSDNSIKTLLWNEAVNYNWNATVRCSQDDEFDLVVATDEAIKKLLRKLRKHLQNELYSKIKTLDSLVED